MHYGTNGQAACGASRLLAKGTTFDLESTDCVRCLWILLANSFDANEKIANRIRLVVGPFPPIAEGAIQ